MGSYRYFCSTTSTQVVPKGSNTTCARIGEEICRKACCLCGPKTYLGQAHQKGPRSRTLVAVHEEILNDMVYPAEIVGKRIRIRLDGSRLFKIHLDKNQQTNVEHKTDTFAAVYKKLTGKEVTFEFPEPVV